VTIAMSPYAKLVGVLGDASLLAYDDPEMLYARRDEIWEKLAALTRRWTTRALIDAMTAVDIWCGEVKTHLQAAADPQVEHLGAVTSYVHPRAGEVKVIAPAVKFGETPAAIERPAPMLGEHSVEILREFGLTRDEIDALVKDGVVFQDLSISAK
jgi:crotonobetainyl-CoA:carnitine CoA-transferase CaiB-like acyl-CoA transferase